MRSRAMAASVLVGVLSATLIGAVPPAGSAGTWGDLTPAPGSPVAVDENPFGVVAVDLNGDDAPDLASISKTGFTASVALGDGQGGFAGAVDYPAGFDPTELAAGDVDNDDDLDLIVLNDEAVIVNQQGTLDDVRALLNAGDGTFTAATPSLFGPRPSAMEVADLTGDGTLDIAITNVITLTETYQLTFEIHRGLGNGTFDRMAPVVVGERSYPLSTGPFEIESGFFDAGPTRDIAVADSGTKDLSVWLGTGNGGFAQAGDPVSLERFAGEIVAADFDHDLDTDLAVAHFSYFSVSILSGDGAGGFTRTQIVETGSVAAETLALGDVNDDGEIDLFTGAGNTHGASVLLGDGNGGFTPGWGAPHTPGSNRDVASADFNGDGFADAAYALVSGSSLSVLLSQVDQVAPTTAIGLTPAAPDGAAGWYVSPVTVVVGAEDTGPGTLAGIQDKRCLLDPTPPPPTYSDLAPGCSVDGTEVATDGFHLVAGAAKDLSGNVSPVSSASFQLDGTDPVLAPVLTPAAPVAGTSATMAPHASDATSGIATSACDPIDTSTPGTREVICSASDVAGNTSSVSVQYTVAAASYRPDLLIRMPGGSWIGGNAYGGYATQVVRQSIFRPGASVTSYVRIENDGNRADRVRVQGAASTQRFVVNYFVGTTRITGAVVAGSWHSPLLQPGQSAQIRVVVTRTRLAVPGDLRTVWLRGRSLANSTRSDAVATIIRARR